MARAVCEKKQAVEAMAKSCVEEDGHERVEEGAGEGKQQSRAKSLGVVWV